MKVKRLHPDSEMPAYTTQGSCGADLIGVSLTRTEHYVEFGTGLAMEIPAGHVGLVFPRSSISKTLTSMANSVGVIDRDYRGEVTVRFRHPCSYEVGDRIAQLVVVPCERVEFEETVELTDTARGDGGYGSTGR